MKGAGIRARATRSRTLRARQPAVFIPPMKALGVESVPPGDWRLEIKFDGYRAVAVVNDGTVELWSRNEKPLTAGYPEVVAALRELRCTSAVLDGEIVAMDDQGRSRFQLLQQRDLKPGAGPIIFYVFDLLQQDGNSLLDRPIEERQEALRVLIGARKGGAVRLSPVFDSKPEQLLAAAREQGLEGIIAKRAGSVYEPDRRSGAWLKWKVHGEQEFVIGGFTPPKNSRPHFGAILVGYYQDGRLQYAGKVGSGFGHAKLASLHAEFRRRRVDDSPFVNLPLGRRSRFGGGMTAGEMRHVTWIAPELVCQVRFTEWTDDGLLRHPVFLGLRSDKNAREVRREAGPASA